MALGKYFLFTHVGDLHPFDREKVRSILKKSHDIEVVHIIGQSWGCIITSPTPIDSISPYIDNTQCILTSPNDEAMEVLLIRLKIEQNKCKSNEEH
jgi:hypothetical protein